MYPTKSIVPIVHATLIGMFCLATTSSTLGQSVNPPLSDQKSLVFQSGSFSVSNNLSIYTNTPPAQPGGSAIYSEYNIAGLNPEGIFKASVSGTFLSSTPAVNSPRRITSQYYSGNGIVQTADSMVFTIQDRALNANDENFRDMAPGATSLAYDHRVDGVLRQVISNGGTHFGVRLIGDTGGVSIMDPADPVTLHIEEYYANPFDGLQQITGDTGFAFRGHAADFVTQGSNQLLSPDNKTFSVSLGAQNAVNVAITDSLGGNWSLKMGTPDGSLLKTGDTFLTQRFANPNFGFGSLDFVANGFGYGQPNGWLQVNEALYNANNELLKLDAIFRITPPPVDGFLGNPSSFGHIKFSAVPEPGTLSALALAGVTGYLVRRRKMTRSQLATNS